MKLKYITTGLALLLLASCAREKSAGLNDDAKRYFDAWISRNHPSATRTPLGAYVLEETPGTGIDAASLAYIRVNYTTYTLAGQMQNTTVEKVARQNGNYDETKYYGPIVGYRGDGLEVMAAGLEEAISTMKVGGRKKVVVPGWLSEAERFYTEEEYIENCSGTDLIYDLELVDAFDDIEAWELDSLRRYMKINYPSAVEDAEQEGFFYVKTRDGLDMEFPSDTTVYINYTGRLLNGRAFDTTVADTAKVWGLYSSSKTYAQQQVKWFSSDQDYTSITLGEDETSVIPGFAYGLSVMHPGEAGKCFFVSKYGYSGSGSGNSIPSFSPLCFELELTEKP